MQGTQTVSGLGYTFSIVFPAMTPTGGTTASYTLSLDAPSQGVPSPASSCSPNGLGTPLIYLVFTPALTVTLSQGPPESFTLPSSVSTSGKTFYTAFDDLTSPNHECLSGGATVNGQTVSFPGGMGGTTLTAGHTYELVFLYY
jgi:hypothetical protein